MKDNAHYSKATLNTVPYTESDWLAIYKYIEENRFSITTSSDYITTVTNVETNKYSVYPGISKYESLLCFAADMLAEQLCDTNTIVWKTNKNPTIGKEDILEMDIVNDTHYEKRSSIIKKIDSKKEKVEKHSRPKNNVIDFDKYKKSK